MLSVCPYFHVHQPYRIKRYRVFDIGEDNEYFNDSTLQTLNNRQIIEEVAEHSYRPMTTVLQELLDTQPDFKFSLSFSGTVLDQFETYTPDVLEAFQALVASGRVELLADTSHHSLAFFFSPNEFARQVDKHERRLKSLFGVKPRVFRNTELAYRNDLAKWCEKRGYLGVITEGWEKYLGWRSPNYVYRPAGCQNIKVLLKNHKLTDDIALRFGNRGWEAWPLRAETYASWINAHHGDGQTINLFMDLESFGRRQWQDTGIFNFLSALPAVITTHPETSFKTVSETLEANEPAGEYDVPDILTWGEAERDLTAWIGSPIQRDAIHALYALEDDILYSGKRDLIEQWRKLQTSDHFYYMGTRQSDTDLRQLRPTPYQSPYEAYMAFMNALSDLQLRVTHAVEEKQKREAQKATRAEVQPEPPTDGADSGDTPDKTSEDVAEEKSYESIWSKLKRWFGNFIGGMGFRRPVTNNQSS